MQPRISLGGGFSTRPLPAALQWVAARPALLHSGTNKQSGFLHLVQASPQQKSSSGYLSDFITFESDLGGSKTPSSTPENAEEARAAAALKTARDALQHQKQQSPSQPTTSLYFAPSDRLAGQARQESTREELERALLSSVDALDSHEEPSRPPIPSQLKDGKNAAAEKPPPPAWAENVLGKDDFFAGPKLQAQTAEKQPKALEFAEPAPLTAIEMRSEEEEYAAAMREKSLPPLQSVLELTTAVRMPQRGEEPALEMPQSSAAGRAMEDGRGVLQDGTRFVRESGEEKSEEDGRWYRWTRLAGISQGGKVEWEERWWEASDWNGMKEMGAEKSGVAADGSAWRETWREALTSDAVTGEPIVERSAHKWAHDAKGDEWEEKWGESYRLFGAASKWADKWGKEGPNVWHERWGEDYDGSGGCIKWTDKWAERLLEGGSAESWGDKWDERFKAGAGNKTGETWSVNADGHRYQRWWGENHFGNGWVQKYGNSTAGEQWDVSEQMDTYYNPIPHFTYQMALDHSPVLRDLPTLPRPPTPPPKGPA